MYLKRTVLIFFILFQFFRLDIDNINFLFRCIVFIVVYILKLRIFYGFPPRNKKL
jgi:hypothetical protein